MEQSKLERMERAIAAINPSNAELQALVCVLQDYLRHEQERISAEHVPGIGGQANGGKEMENGETSG